MRMEVTLRLAVNGSGLTGTMTMDGETAEILDGQVKGDHVSFAIASGADDIPKFEFQGSIVGDTLTVTVSGRLKNTREELRIGEGNAANKGGQRCRSSAASQMPPAQERREPREVGIGRDPLASGLDR